MVGGSHRPGIVIVAALGALLFKDGAIYQLSKLEFTVCLVIAVVIVLVCDCDGIWDDDDGRW